MSGRPQNITGGERPPQTQMLHYRRNVSYKIGMVCLVFCFTIFMIGFCTSHWIHFEGFQMDVDGDSFTDITHANMHWGLWDAPCMPRVNNCNTEFVLTQVFMCTALCGYVLCFGVWLYENCRQVDPITYHSRKLELAILGTAVAGSVGMGVFIFAYTPSFYHNRIGWSMTPPLLAVIGTYSVLILILCSNRKPEARHQGMVVQSQGGTSVVHYTSSGHPYGTTTVVHTQGQAGYHHQQYGPHSQPLLPQQQYPPQYPPQQQYGPQPYSYPPSHQPQAPPPPYSLPPAYSAYMSQPPPPHGYQPAHQHEEFAQASAPLFDSNSLPKKG